MASGSPACQVRELNTAMRTVTSYIDLPSCDPIGIAILPDGSRVYVTSRSTDAVYVIDPAAKTVIDTIAVGDGPSGIAIGPVPQ